MIGPSVIRGARITIDADFLRTVSFFFHRRNNRLHTRWHRGIPDSEVVKIATERTQLVQNEIVLPA